MNKIVNDIAKAIKNNRKFLILAHDNLDGDSLGSGLALGLALRSMGKNVQILLKESIPKQYCFLPGINKLVTKSLKNKNANVLFVLDTAGWDQIENFSPRQFKEKIIINIDHHIDNKRFGAINWISTKASAVGEQIYTLLKKMSVSLTADIAVCLYTAIFTDTGSFQFSNTTPTTHRIISHLLQCGLYPHFIAENIYENISLSKLRLFQKALKTLKEQNQIIWVWVTTKMLRDTNAEQKDTERFIDYLKAVRNIRVAILFKETSGVGKIRVTFRSKDQKIPVNKIAHKFGGGGHPAAAGCTVQGSRKEVEKRVIKAVKATLNK